MPQRQDPTPPADKAEIAAAQGFIDLKHGALSYIAADGLPGISRIAIGRDERGVPLTLISSLAPHWAGLQAHPDCALMLGEPGPKGDPLTHPRLMLRARAQFVGAAERPALRDLWLATHPKTKLYIDFADFGFVRLIPVSGLLNAGFGKARRIAAQDLLHSQ
ncbi:HugZ family protein [Pseudorhodobacter ferrugineus]|uniref:HugZ family pyridoxamine 5'-phosphate oxidase n=1 Tax=Pseudorhodobacter ferrugineus TaxID=77008 RepID=UPI0003B506E8|nr:pyridoxamine 5'-phosphate oxidase [Pseudorhodobacter ferrugineus]